MSGATGEPTFNLELASELGGAFPVPSLLMMITKALVNRAKPNPVCLVLPETRYVAELSAIIASIHFLDTEFEKLREDFLKRGFPVGSYVRATSDGSVYRVGEKSEYGLKLHFIDKNNERSAGGRIIPPEDLCGYELTQRRRPMAKPGEKPAPYLTALDELIGIRTLGNTSIVKNRVVLLGQKTEFERVLELVYLTRKGSGLKFPKMSEYFSWGTVTDNGISVEFPSGAAGQPLVAIARDPRDLRKIFVESDVGFFSNTIITSNISGVMGHLDDIDRVAMKQRVILLAEARRRQEVAVLKQNGWTVWEAQPWEIFRATESIGPTGIDGVDVSRRAAAAELSRNIPRIIAEFPQIEYMYDTFTTVGDILNDEEVQDLPAAINCREQCKAIFFEIASWLSFPTDEQIAQIRWEAKSIQLSSSNLRTMIGNESVDKIAAFVGAIEKFLDTASPSQPTPKGQKLLEFATNVHKSPTQTQVVVTGHKNSSVVAKTFLANKNISLECLTANELRHRETPFRVVVLNALWPAQFARVIDPWPAASLGLVGYRFEIQIYERWIAQRDRQRAKLEASEDVRSAITGMSPSDLPRKPQNHPSQIKVTTIDDGAPAFEQLSRSRERDWSIKPQIRLTGREETTTGYFCRFVGQSWTVFSEDHQVTKIINAGLGSKTGITRVEATELRQGDRIMMREPGQKDAIRQLAEEEIGIRKYSELRTKAWLWRKTLIDSRDTAEDIARKLAIFGVRKNIATIRSWLTFPEMIGPRLRGDVLAICDAYTPAAKNSAQWDECWTAISELRSLHISAGARLSEIISEQCGALLLDPSEEEIRVQLSLGTAWILEIAHRDDALSAWPEPILNHLQWDQYTPKQMFHVSVEMRS
jgi:hypothetical protein